MLLYVLGTAFTLWMAVACVRRGQANPWLWIVLLFGPIGSAVYFVSEYLGPNVLRSGGSGRASRRELHHAEAEVRRLDNSEAWTHYAHVLRSRKQFDEAAAAAEKAAARDAENRRALYELGLARLGREDFEEASAALERLVERDPGYASGEARYALAVAYEKSGRRDEARGALEELARTTSLPKVLFSLAALQARSGQTARARETLERILDEANYVPAYHQREVRPWVRKARKALASLPPS